MTADRPYERSTVTAERWFGAGKCLVRDEATDETFTAARLLPGERATLERFERAGRRVPVARDILRASPHRVEPACPHFDRCTGCDLLHVSEDEEVRYKQLTVREVLARHAGIEVSDVAFVGPRARGDHRARAALTWDVETNAMGLRDFGGRVVHIPDCPANTPAVRQVLEGVATRFTTAIAGRVEVIEGVEGCALVVENADVETSTLLQIEGVVAAARRDNRDLIDIVGVWPAQRGPSGANLAAAPGAWTQPNPAGATALYDWVLTHCDHADARVLDATCGTGGLSLLLAQRARFVLGVDANWPAVESARASAALQRVENAAFRGGKIQTVAARMQDDDPFDVTLINPMRASLGEPCMRDLAALTHRQILYLAPAPRAGAADVRALVDAGFHVERVAAVNLHPGTGKVMMAVALARSNPTPEGSEHHARGE